jgi:hypothetical protein
VFDRSLFMAIYSATLEPASPLLAHCLTRSN